MSREIQVCGDGTFNNLTKHATFLLGTSSQAEYRSTTHKSVGLRMERGRLTVTLRDNIPEIDPKGNELFPYRRIEVFLDTDRTPKGNQTLGAKSRNLRGILVDWKGGQKAPRREALRPDQRQYPLYPVEFSEYDYLVSELSPEQQHDKYGRTNAERDLENAIVNRFADQTKRLIDLARSEGKGELVSASSTFSYVDPNSYHYIARYPLADGKELLIRQTGLKVHLLLIYKPNTQSPIDEYALRSTDKRLGYTRFIDNKPQATNPLTAERGESIVSLLETIR